MNTSRLTRLAIVITHPIQYYAPLFKILTDRGRIDLKVFYTWGQECLNNKFDPGFEKVVQWDIPLLEGYPYMFLENSSENPGSHSFSGIDNPYATKTIAEFSPDAVLVYGWSYRSHLKIIRYFKGKIPVIFRGDSTLLDEQKGWKQVFRSLVLRWIYSYVDKAIYVGKANKAYFKRFGLSEQQLHFAPHAIDNERFRSERTTESAALRKKFGLGEHDVLILFAGKLESKKDPELLLEAVKNLKFKNIHLLFVGNGNLEGTLKAKSAFVENIHFLEFQNQQKMPAVYQACDVFCLPSKGPGETWGLAVNEAMAAGKAVLISNKVGCGPDLVKENGMVFRSGDLEDLTQKLKLIASDRATLANLGRASLRIIEEWSFTAQATAIERICNEY